MTLGSVPTLGCMDALCRCSVCGPQAVWVLSLYRLSCERFSKKEVVGSWP